MKAASHTYLKDVTGAEINEEKKKSTFIFQKERIGFKKSAELIFLKEVNPEIKKEIIIAEDELIISATIPNSLKRFDEIEKEDRKSKWMFAHQLIKKVDAHPFPRLNLVVCPENIVYSRGMESSFIYYGVMGSLPPFENNEERVWLETKAAVATVVDGGYTYDEFVKYYKTLELKDIGSNVMAMPDSQSLLDYIEEQLNLLETTEKTFVKLPQKKWKTTKWLSIGLSVLFIPALILIISFFIYENPKNKAYIDSYEHYLNQNYSEVVTTLNSYKLKGMPYVVLYELAHSYVMNESLDEEQKKNVLANITLQTDTDYLKYWIYIGRGEAEKAVDVARSMEDGELLTYGLLKRREEVQADSTLSGEEKQKVLMDIDSEVEAYEDLMEQEEEREQQEENEKTGKEKEKALEREKELEIEKELEMEPEPAEEDSKTEE